MTQIIGKQGSSLEKGAALGDFICKFKLATWLESIDATRSIELFEDLLTNQLFIFTWVVAYKHFSDAYGIGDAKIAIGILKHFGLVGIPAQCFEEAAQRYHYSEKEICDRFSAEFKKHQAASSRD